MKLIYLSKELDNTKEHELLSNNDFGFNVQIKYNNKGTYKDEFNIFNCTEVHYLWSLDYMGGPSIAFESDIHQTGFLRRTDHIESVVIELSDKLFDRYYTV